MTILISVLIISTIAALLATLLVISQKYLANYGQCKITINKEKELTVEGGESLLNSLSSEKIFLASACGGRGTCGYCKCKITQGGGPVLPTETPFLTKLEIESNARLSCQVKVRSDMEIEIPEELLSVQLFQTICTEITDLTYDIKLFRFELDDPTEISYTPGQYAQLMCPKYPGNPESVSRAYSIASDPEDKHAIELIIRKVPNGICTTYCFEHLKIGDPVQITAPYGQFRLTETQAPMVFIAGGSGMAPIKNLLHKMVNENITRQATFFFGGNHENDMFYDDLMTDFQQKLPNFKFVPVIANPPENWTGKAGLVTQAVNDCFDDLSNHEAYLCGSPGMIDASITILKNLKMPEDKIYYDKFA